MKLVILVNRFKKCGPLNVIHNLVKNLKGYDIYLVSLVEHVDENFNDYNFEKHCKKVVSLNFKLINYINVNSLKVNLSKVVGDFDILHSHGFFPDLYSKTIKGKFIHVSTIHNNMFEDYKLSYGILGLIMIFIHKNVVKRIEYPILCSGSLVDDYKKHGMNFNFINNGIDDIYFNNKANQNITENNFISIGNLTVLKNPEIIFNVFNKINSQPFNLKFLGTGPLISLQNMITNKSIEFLGYRTDVNEQLKTSKYYISASSSEGLPNSALEALASGNSLILSNIPSHLYLKSIFKESVVIFRDQDELGVIIDKILSNNIKLNRPDIEQVYKLFSGNSMAGKYDKLYKGI